MASRYVAKPSNVNWGVKDLQDNKWVKKNLTRPEAEALARRLNAN